jgi:hypothetical protein
VTRRIAQDEEEEEKERAVAPKPPREATLGTLATPVEETLRATSACPDVVE